VSSSLFGLIPAAGAGARFAGETRKQYVRIGTEPMIVHAVRALAAHPRIETIFVVLASDDAEFERCDWRGFGDRLAPLYCGGANRRDSVFNGLVAMANIVDPDNWVLVHDAARPCLAAADLARLIVEASADEVGGILAVPLADTLKRSDGDRRIVVTESRTTLWQAQTPQMFRHGLLIDALSRASDVTDEAGAREALGLRPRLVSGSIANFKVTHPEDAALATAWLAKQGRT
jgi:2-C-methyl-D-erythritol 4-phosphate cytidylyltransferase